MPKAFKIGRALDGSFMVEERDVEPVPGDASRSRVAGPAWAEQEFTGRLDTTRTGAVAAMRRRLTGRRDKLRDRAAEAQADLDAFEAWATTQTGGGGPGPQGR